MTPLRARSVCSTLAIMLPAMVFLVGGPVHAKPVKPMGKAAKHKGSTSSKPKETSKDSDSLGSSSTSDTASSTETKVEPSLAAATSTTTSTSIGTSEPSSKPSEPLPTTSTATPSSGEPSSDTAAPTDGSLASPASTPAPASEPIVPYDPPALFVQNLGPASYPGTMRGLHGGSLWLEPSFHGLQWPQVSKSGVGVSGSVWVDSGFSRVDREIDTMGSSAMYLQQGRAVLRFTPTYTDGKFFVQAQVEIVGNHCQRSGEAAGVCRSAGSFDADDLWVRVGQWNRWDLQVGRFRGWELYHVGMGLDMYTVERQGAFIGGARTPGNIPEAPMLYGTSFLRERPASGLGIGYVAFHAYLNDHLRFELLGELGTDDTTAVTPEDATSSGATYIGGRPAAVLDMGWLKIKAGAEYERKSFTTQRADAAAGVKESLDYLRTRSGVGGTVQMVFAPTLEIGASFARGSQSETDLEGGTDEKASYTTMSVGGFANLRLGAPWLLGAGVHFTMLEDTYIPDGASNADYSSHLQGFLALQYLVAGNLYVKGVLSFAQARFLDADASVPEWNSYAYGARVRMMYLF